MRTTLDLPEELVAQARTAVGFKSKTDTVIFALREVVRRQRIEELKKLMGTIRFEFDPTEIRKKDRRRVAGSPSSYGQARHELTPIPHRASK